MTFREREKAYLEKYQGKVRFYDDPCESSADGFGETCFYNANTKVMGIYNSETGEFAEVQLGFGTKSQANTRF